jgi:hypothetical protein
MYNLEDIYLEGYYDALCESKKANEKITIKDKAKNKIDERYKKYVTKCVSKNKKPLSKKGWMIKNGLLSGAAVAGTVGVVKTVKFGKDLHDAFNDCGYVNGFEKDENGKFKNEISKEEAKKQFKNDAKKIFKDFKDNPKEACEKYGKVNESYIDGYYDALCEIYN